MKTTKLVSGKMNIPYIICKPGYAEGVRRPQKEAIVKPFNAVIKLRKLEFKAA